MNTIELLLDDEQIRKLKELTIAAGEPKNNWQAMAQVLLNGAISNEGTIEEKIENQEFLCPNCGENDFDIKGYNDGKIKRNEITCINCDWNTEE
jgi:predicted RNA-binding Zn-ribbon protein involved in translation (DUF1610 family)